MLADELPPKHIVFSRINIILHDPIAKDVERFKREGGKIKQCAIGDNTTKPTAKLKRENNEN